MQQRSPVGSENARETTLNFFISESEGTNWNHTTPVPTVDARASDGQQAARIRDGESGELRGRAAAFLALGGD